MGKIRGIRGAITVKADNPDLIKAATKELLLEIEKRNQLVVTDIAAVVFSATPDLQSAYPAVAARELGWTTVPLFCLTEMAVSGALDKCIRVLILYNTDLDQEEVNHIYLRGAQILRPDLVGGYSD